MSNTESTATEKWDVYARVTDQIVTVIEDGGVAHGAEIIEVPQNGISDYRPLLRWNEFANTSEPPKR